MTQLFGRLAPGATVESARADVKAAYGIMVKDHPEAYSPQSDSQVDVVLLRDQITARARTVLLVLLGASVLMFVIACSNVVNLILARTVRREGELSIRAALGAGTGGALCAGHCWPRVWCYASPARRWVFSVHGRWWRFWGGTPRGFPSVLSI